MKLSQDEMEVVNAVKYRPAVSIIFPFKANISLKTELQRKLRDVTDFVRKQLQEMYPQEQYQPILDKLKNIKDTLDYNRVVAGLAIFVSPVFTKVFYLDLPVTEKIVIDESFEIRDIVYESQAASQYVTLIINNEDAKAFLGNGLHITPLKFQVPKHAAYVSETPERVANFSTPSERKEVIMDKFLHYVDIELAKVLKKHPLPVFVLGTERTLGHFKKETKHLKNIAGTINGNFINSTDAEILSALKSEIEQLSERNKHNLLVQLDDAIHAGRYTTGIHAVWRAANEKLGRILLVEKDYMYPAELGEDGNTIRGYDQKLANQLHIIDAVDDAIEKVLQYGGKVAFMDNGSLNEYSHIALIQYY